MLLSSAAIAPRDAGTPEFASPLIRSARRAGELRLVLFAVLAISLTYVGWRIGRGWVAWDDGALGHTAERVLLGELPHRDFDEIYTGGLGYLNAVAFRVFGTTLWTLRLVLLAFFVAWVPAVYYVASRFVAPVAAGAATLLAVVWSVPNYPAAMPSWYNLFFATFGVAALLRYLEDARRRWLLAAGLAGGLSFLVKSVGLYYVAGALLFLVYQSHAESRAAAKSHGQPGHGYAFLVTAALTTFVSALVALLRHRLHPPEVAQFIVPAASVAAFLIWNEWAAPAGSSRARLAALVRVLLPFAVGVALPVLIFLVPYVRVGALDAFVNGVFVLPTKRFGFATYRAAPLWTLVSLLPLVGLVLGASRIDARAMSRWLAGLAVVLAALFVTALRSDAVYSFVWFSARNLPLLLVVAGVFLLARDRGVERGASLHRSRTVLLLGVTAVCTLIQFPFAHPIYFCYIAPLVVLTAAALVRSIPTLPRGVLGAVVAFYAAFALARTNGAPLYGMGQRYIPPFRTQQLMMPRGGIEIPAEYIPLYRGLFATLQYRARGGYTWASPDLPEIYFLSGLRNPTRSIFDFFDDPQQRGNRVLAALDAHGVTAVVLSRTPPFSLPLTKDSALVAGLEQRYPYAAEFATYQLRWRP